MRILVSLYSFHSKNVLVWLRTPQPCFFKGSSPALNTGGSPSSLPAWLESAGTPGTRGMLPVAGDPKGDKKHIFDHFFTKQTQDV